MIQNPLLQESRRVETEQRAAVYRLLARLWEREVDDALRNQLSECALAQPLEYCGMKPPAESIEELAVDFCQLFVGPKNHLPPIQSIWSEGQLDGQAAASMRGFIELVPDLDRDSISIPDHLSVQLYLQSAFVLAQSSDVSDDILECQTIAREFYQVHLSWAYRLFSAAESQAKTDFYRSLVKLTFDFLQGEREFMIAT